MSLYDSLLCLFLVTGQAPGYNMAFIDLPVKIDGRLFQDTEELRHFTHVIYTAGNYQRNPPACHIIISHVTCIVIGQVTHPDCIAYT